MIPVKFKLYLNSVPTCQTPPATISLVRTDIDALPIDPNIYRTPSGNGSTYGVSDCQYTYNVGASSLAPGVYRVDISFNGTFVGSAVFKLK